MLALVVGHGVYRGRSRLGVLLVALGLGLATFGTDIGGAAALAATSTPAAGKPSTTGGSTPRQTTTPEGANGGAFNELSKGGGETETTTTTATTEKTSNQETHNSKKTIIVIIIAALVLLSAIGYVIVRDARKNAPTTDPQEAEARSARDTAVMMRKRRAKTKAARKARRANR